MLTGNFYVNVVYTQLYLALKYCNNKSFDPQARVSAFPDRKASAEDPPAQWDGVAKLGGSAVNGVGSLHDSRTRFALFVVDVYL